jgi:hypothetical protein
MANFEEFSDSFFKQKEADTATLIRNSAQLAQGTNPDQEASFQSLASATGTPLETVKALPDAVKQKATSMAVPADAIAKGYPSLSKFLGQPNNMAIAHDDVDNLAGIEKLIGKTSVSAYRPSWGERVHDWIGEAFGMPGREQARATMILTARDMGLTPAEFRAKTGGMSEIPDQIGSKFINSVSFGLIPDVALDPLTTSGGIAAGVGGLAGFLGGPAVVASKGLTRAGALGFTKVAATDSFAKALARGVWRDVMVMGAAFGLGNIGEAIDSPDIATAATETAAAVGTGMLLGVVNAVGARVLPDNTFAQFIARAVGVNAATDEIQGTSLTDERPIAQKVFDYGVNTFFSLKGAGRVQGGWFKDAAKADLAVQDHATISTLSELAAASKLRGRDLESFKNFVTDAAEQEGLTDLFVNPTDLAQAGVDPLQIAVAVPSLREPLLAALQTGTDVKIPVADFVSHIAGNELGQAMVDHMKTDPNGFSKAQADKFTAEEGESLRADVEKLLTEKQGDEAFKASRQVVYDGVLKQLQEAGRFTKDVNEPYATLLSNFYSVQASKLGVTPEEMFARYPVSVSSGSAFGKANTLEEGAKPEDLNQLQSSLSSAVSTLKQEKGTGQQLLGILKNTPGVKAEELAWTGLDTFLAGKKSVTKAEIEKHLEDNQVQVEEITHRSGDPSQDYTQFSKYTLPGGENYREVLMTLPPKDGEQGYKSSHFKEANVIAHLRLNDRVDADGKRVLFVEELQSDWHQEGRKKGYGAGEASVPDAPFKKNWHEMAFRRAVQLAVEEGYDKVAWTTGEQQADRYDLSKQVESITVPMVNEGSRSVRIKSKEGDTTFNLMVDNNGVVDSSYTGAQFRGKTLDEVVGKDMAEKIMKATEPTEFSGEGLKVGGAGMKGFYDQILRKYADTFGKKFGAKVGETEIPTEETGTKVHSLEITPAMRDSADNFSLFQKVIKRRGSFNVETSTINLFKSADLSTFLHESGHFFLETMNKIALLEDAPLEIKADMDTTLKWLGVDSLEAWNAKSLEQQRNAHEQFARGFEAFLFEGKSPSKEMAGVFARFRDWLLSVYKSVSALRVELSDDMRAVFDRMLATENEIKDMEAERAYAPFFKSAEEAGMTADEFKAYHDLGLEATQEAQHQLEARSLRDMKFASNAKSKVLKTLQREVAAKRAAVRREVTKEVMDEPVNQVQTFLKFGVDPETGTPVEGAHKLSIPELEALYGDTPAYKAITDKLGYGKYGMLGVEKGVHPDQVAEMFGFSSGDHMIRTILAAEDSKVKIQALTDQRMLERYGDITSPEALSRAADEAIHNEVRIKFVATELNALQKAIGGRKILAEAAQRYAKEMISRTQVRDLRPSTYTAAEARAARNAETLRAKGDLQGAAIEKRNQLVNMYAAKATREAQDYVEKSVKYLRKFDKDSVRKSVNHEYVDLINTTLERFSLKTQTLKALNRQASLVKWMAGQKELGLVPDIAPDLLNEAYRKNYKDMSVEELRGLVDSVKQIEHMGRLKNKLLTAKDNRDFATTVNGIVSSIQENAGGRIADNTTRAGTGAAAERLFNGYLASHRKVASLARELDGFKDGGPVWETWVRAMNEAGTSEASRRSTATKNVGEILNPIMHQGRMGGKGLYFESVGRSFNREERIGLALNTGNASNMQRLLGGERWKREQIQPILDSLTAEDAKYIQSVWDLFESFRPEIAAKELRVYGKEPEWIEPTPITIAGVELKGGYYPVKFDRRRSIRAEQDAEAEDAKQQMRGAYTSSTTRRSYTKARVDEVYDRPLLYTMDGLFSGLNEVIHDLSWHEWLIDANRLLRSEKFDGAVRNQYGADVINQFKTSVENIAAGELPSSSAWEKTLAHVRSGAVVAGLGFNLMNGVINTTGIAPAMVRVGPRWVAQGIGELARNPRALVENIHGKSDFMRLRAQTQQRELNEIRNRVNGRSQLRMGIDRAMFLPMEVTQLVVDAPTWWGAYQKALAGGEVENRAVALADQAVLDSQGGGQIKDLAAIQQGGPFQKLLTTFYGYFNAVYNLGVERTKATNFKDPKQVISLANDYLLLFIGPALLGTVLRSVLTNGLDEFEDLPKLATKAANDQISYLMGTLVGVRELTGAAQTMAGVNTYSSGYSGPAGLRFFNEAYRFAQQAEQGEADAAFRRAAVNVVGLGLHLPSTQVNRTLDGLTAMMDGKTSNPVALATGGPRQ